MSEAIKDCSVKLFGKTIGFTHDKVEPEQRQSSSAATSVSSPDTTDISDSAFTETKHGDNSMNSTEETSTVTASSSSGIEFEKDSLSETRSNEEEPIERATLNKPDKIVSCPRCISKDTKFCYYNNNNQNQPRHFCKNCQRYWTNGGVIRNLPVGSGRRKSKSAAIPNYPHVTEPNEFVVFGSDGSVLNESNTSRHSSRLGAPRVSVVFYPTTSYWDCAVPQPCVPLTSTLGKRLREETITRPSNSGRENLTEETNPKRSVLTPKTLRFDVPDEVAKSSIWAALGIKNDKIGSIKGTSLFKAFEGKGVRNSNIDSAAMVLQANPAALSRSLSFHESS